jgi:hypothetical protein
MSPIINARLALAAAHGITSRVINTWYPLLPRDPRVMVPIQVDALIIRQTGAQWADTQMQPTPAQGSNVPAQDLLPKPFAMRKDDRPRGVYLHWALPEALTRGSQTKSAAEGAVANANTVFPATPDRWLIARLSPSPTLANRRAVKAWILQAHDNNPLPLDLDGWIEPGKPPDGLKNPLTALGYGDLSWAGYFESTLNRLSFYDDLHDIANGPLAYLVCGWYSDPSLDPLGSSKIHSLADFHAQMQLLGWTLPDGDLDESKVQATENVIAAKALGLRVRALRANPYINRFENAFSLGGGDTVIGYDPNSGRYATDGSWWPQLTILHGSVIGIGWPGIGWEGNPTGVWNPKSLDTSVGGEVGGPPPASSISVAVGNTITETLARLVATGVNRPDETRILEAFQLHALNVLNEPDGAARVDSLLHSIEFGSLPGGEGTETIFQPPTSVNQAPPANPPEPGPGVFGRYQHASFTNAVNHLSDVVSGVDFGVSGAKSPAVNAPEFLQEKLVSTGRLSDLLNQVAIELPPQPQPGKFIEVKRTLARFFHPTDPILLVQGGKASFKHKSGSFSKDGLLYCRLTGDWTTETSCREPTFPGEPVDERPSVRGADLLERGLENGSIPPECDGLLNELALLDPGTSTAAGGLVAARRGRTAAYASAVARNFLVEQTAWHAIRDPRVDHGPLIAASGIAGRLPSPIAVSLPARPWNPIRLDWRVRYIPSQNGLNDWDLKEIDYEPKAAPAGDGVTLDGSSILTQGANNIVASAIRDALAQAASSGGSGNIDPSQRIAFISARAKQAMLAINSLSLNVVNQAGAGVPSIDRLPLDDIASALSDMDVLTGGLDGFTTLLRGGYRGDGISKPGDGDPQPRPFFQVRAGFLRIERLRLVDGFGQFLELLQSPNGGFNSNAVIKSDPMAVAQHDDLALLPPRYTSPARLWFRYIDANGSGKEAITDPQGTNAISPVCGYVMPNHLDAALEFFDADGTNLGFVRPQSDRTIAWEEAPGQPSTVGRNPELAIPNKFAGGIARALVDWGMADAGLPSESDNALQALLRVIDSTLWAVDPYGHVGDEHLSLLIGHPVVVVRAQLRLELQEPIQPDLVNLTVIPVRIGALAHWQDGLFGYFVNDDYRKLYATDAAAAGLARQIGPNRGFLQPINLVPAHFAGFAADTGRTPVTHPYVDTSGVLFIQPNQNVNLTLLVEPHTTVHATAGLVPRKEIGLRRDWVDPALKTLSPTFRFGPLLVDPKRIRMPIPTDIQGTWSWDYRSDANTWAELPVTNATQDALLPPDPPSGAEGWLRLTPPSDQNA